MVENDGKDCNTSQQLDISSHSQIIDKAHAPIREGSATYNEAMESAITVEIRVRPNSSRNRVHGTAGDPPRLVVAVQAPAVDGKANQAVIKEIAHAFGVRARDISIVFGELTRDKRVQIRGEVSELESRLAELMGTLGL